MPKFLVWVKKVYGEILEVEASSMEEARDDVESRIDSILLTPRSIPFVSSIEEVSPPKPLRKKRKK